MVSLVLLIFAGFYAAIYHKQMVAVQYNKNLQARMLSNYIAYETDLALTYDENFTREVYFPEDVGGVKYNITYSLGNNCTVIFVNYENNFAFSCTSANLTGTLHPGNNILSNKHGVIYAN